MVMKKILIGGKFNQVHLGHLWLLRKAKRMGRLIVVLAHDKHNKRSYATSSKLRKKSLEKFRLADKIVVGSSSGFVGVVKKYKPDVIVLGYDQKLPDRVTSDYVKKNKIKIVRFSKHGTYSTRKLHE